MDAGFLSVGWTFGGGIVDDSEVGCFVKGEEEDSGDSGYFQA